MAPSTSSPGIASPCVAESNSDGTTDVSDTTAARPNAPYSAFRAERQLTMPASAARFFGTAGGGGMSSSRIRSRVARAGDVVRGQLAGTSRAELEPSSRRKTWTSEVDFIPSNFVPANPGILGELLHARPRPRISRMRIDRSRMQSEFLPQLSVAERERGHGVVQLTVRRRPLHPRAAPAGRLRPPWHRPGHLGRCKHLLTRPASPEGALGSPRSPCRSPTPPPPPPSSRSPPPRPAPAPRRAWGSHG